MLKIVAKEIRRCDTRRNAAISKELSNLNITKSFKPLILSKGEIKDFFSLNTPKTPLYDVDINALFDLLSLVPAKEILVTENYIQTNKKINIASLEAIIALFEKLMKATNDNEKDWQSFFNDYGWILNNLFPYQAILFQKEAYLGGKALSNKDGKVVDFLFQNGFQDNYALLEIKNHNSELLKKKPYRGSNVFALSEELSGALSQVIDQKDTFVKNNAVNHQSFDPKVILLIGTKKNLCPAQKGCFELVRGNQKHVDIVTFDELLEKLVGLLNILHKI